MKQAWALLVLWSIAAVIAGSTDAAAQSSTTYAAGNQWGTTPSGLAVPGALESAQMHNANGLVAAAVNAARQGALVSNGSSGGSTTISSIGSQTVVTSSVVSTNSTVSSPINATQTSSNSGDVSNQGTISSR